jgi:hypothetical protein
MMKTATVCDLGGRTMPTALHSGVMSRVIAVPDEDRWTALDIPHHKTES